MLLFLTPNMAAVTSLANQQFFRFPWQFELAGTTEREVRTVKLRFNEPVYNEVLDITNDILQPDQSYSKMYGTEPRCNETRYNEILDITTIEDPKRKIYPDITNKCHHATKDECETDQVSGENPLK